MSNSRVIFVRPPNLQKSGEWEKQGVIRCPLNIALLASFIHGKGNYITSIVDFEIIPVTSSVQMAKIILEGSPKYVCFTTLTPRFPIIVKIAQEIKKLDPKVINIVGGPHVTGEPEMSLFEGISFGIVGEGEESLLELLNTLEKGEAPYAIKNLIYRYNGNIIVNEVRSFITNLDELPFPAWDLMHIDEYVDPLYFKGSHLATFTTRGCPYDCNFCASAVTWKRILRFRSIENIMNEIRHIVKVLKVNNLMFWDDSFAVDEDRAVSLCNWIIEEKLKINYTVQIRADSVSQRLIAALKDSGCSFAAIGVESGNEEMLIRMGKRETKEQFRRAIRMMKDARLPSIASYIIGLPGDTHETIRETIDFAFELDAVQSKFMILTPYPGTRIYRLAKQKGLIDPKNFEQMEAANYYDSVYANLSCVSDDDLIKYQDEAYKRFDQLKRENES